jgi:hypothetical protein
MTENSLQQAVGAQVTQQIGSVAAIDRTKRTRESLAAELGEKRHDIATVVVSAIFGASIILFAAATVSTGLTFRGDLSSTLPSVASTLLFVSLFVERVIEVFVSAWSDRDADEHQQNLEYWQSRQGQLKGEIADLISELNASNPPNDERKATINELFKVKRADIEDARANEDVEAKALIPSAARTRRISTWIGLAVGILVSAAGFRFLGQMVSLDSIYNPAKGAHTTQYALFVVADVLLTGAVLAGGSKAVHQIFSVYDEFMKSTQDNLAKGRTK